MAMRQKTTRELLEAEITSLKEVRKPFEQDWEEIGRLCSPARVDIKQNAMAANARVRRRSNTTSQDSEGRRANRTLVNGMATGLTSASRPWFKLTTRDPDLRDYQPVKEWLAYVEGAIYNFFAKTNYYDTTKVQYADLGPMGAAAVVTIEHPQYGAVYHHAPVGTFWLGLDEGLRLNSFVRDVNPTVSQLYSWVKGDTKLLTSDTVRAYDKGDYQTRVPCVHVIERNIDTDGKRRSPKVSKPWRSIRWEVGQNKKDILLTESGYDSQPVTAPRWETVGDQVYCDTSPGFEALPELRELQLAARRAGRAMDNMVKPALQAPSGLARAQVNLDPGTVNYYDSLSGQNGGIKPILQLDPRVIEAVRTERDRIARQVQELFYADLFFAISQMDGVQPRNEQELFFRNEEKLTQLGPVVDRVNIEKLEVDIERAFIILKNNGMLPPIPDELRSKPLDIEFISILAQAQKQTSSLSIERAARFVGFLIGAFPEAGIKFDAEQAIDEFAQASGVTPTIIRSDEIVAQMKQDMENQAQAQTMANMMPAAAQGAQAAKLLSETQVDDAGTTALQRMLGQ
jgi:hypothetical protein